MMKKNRTSQRGVRFVGNNACVIVYTPGTVAEEDIFHIAERAEQAEGNNPSSQ